MQSRLMGLDIGGTKCAVSLGTLRGELIDKLSFPTAQPLGPQQAIDNLLSCARTLLDRHQAQPRAIGIACGSPLDPVGGVIQSPAQLSSWKDVPIVHVVSEHLGAPAFLENDANAGALAEYRFGAGRGCRNMVFLTFGTGMGAGLILDGRLYRGANTYAGEVGHMRLAPAGPVGCRKAGSFEGFCSGAGIAQIAREQRVHFMDATSLPAAPSAKEVGEAAARDDPLALHILQLTGRYLGLGLAYILDMLNPDRIVIGSIFVRCEQFLRPAMEAALRTEALEQTHSVCQIVPASLNENIGDYAALAIAYENCLDTRK